MKIACVCLECGKAYSVAAVYQGRRVRCQQCGAAIVVPMTDAPTETGPVPGRTPSPTTGETSDRQRVGRFEIRRRLGAGGFGVVYQAFDPLLDREVALKVPHPHRFENEVDKTRVLREAKASARLHHPHIVPVYEAGSDGSSFYIACAYVEGQTLESRAGKGDIEFRQSARIVQRLAEALDHAHRLGIIHRDVKPQNIMLDQQDEPLLMDFGLARLAEADSQLTHEGAVLGTPAYMSPEQARGQSEQIGRTSDQYSLGAVLYRLLCGRPPFSGGSAAVLSEVLQREPARPRSLNPRIPGDLETICLKAMAKEAGRRYADCGQLAEDLRRWLAGEPIRARRIGPLERLWRWARRSPLVAGLSAAVALVLVVGILVSTYFGLAAARQARVAIEQNYAAEQNLYYARVALAQRHWLSGGIGEADRVLDSCPAQFRHWEWGYLKRLCHLELLAIRNHTRLARGFALSPDGTRIVGPSDDKTLKAWDLTTGREILTFPEYSSSGVCVAFSPDGKRIATGWGQVRDAATGQELHKLQVRGTPLGGLAFSPDGTRVAGFNTDKRIVVWDAATGRETITLKGSETKSWAARGLAFSPDSKRIAGSRDEMVMIWDVATGREIVAFRGCESPSPSGGGVTTVAFSPDGTRIVSALVNKAVRVWNASTGQESLTLNGHTLGVTCASFSLDGKRIVSGSYDKTIRVWDPGTGAEMFTIHTGESVQGAVFSPDGKRIISSDPEGTLRTWDASRDQEALTLRGHEKGVLSVVFSPDGKRIATASYDHTARVWDANTGQEIFSPLEHKQNVSSVAFSPDGKQIAVGVWDGTVQIWDAGTGQNVRSLGDKKDSVARVAFSADGRRIVSRTMLNEITLWDADTGQETLRIVGTKQVGNTVMAQKQGGQIALSPDGTQIASNAVDGSIQIWDTTTGQEIMTIRGQEGPTHRMTAVAFSPDGVWIASGSADKTITLWNARDGNQLLTFQGHTSSVDSVAFSPDGKRMVSASADRTVRVWDPSTGQEVLAFQTSDYSNSAAFSPNGKRIAAAFGDGTVKVWDAAGF